MRLREYYLNIRMFSEVPKLCSHEATKQYFTFMEFIENYFICFVIQKNQKVKSES